MSAASDSPLYLTGSRPVAAAIKELVPATFASTGGPNTMVATKMTPEVEQAVAWSTAIENSGQCTALRHLVAPCSEESITETFKNGIEVISSPTDSLRKGGFAGVFSDWAKSFDAETGYNIVGPNIPVAITVRSELPSEIEEGWRRLYMDVTTKPATEVVSDDFVQELSRWLVREQPITLAVNDDDPDFSLARKLFENTCQVVYSVGTTTQPALSCQARPQEAEVFGEFAPRREVDKFTKFPVVVPTPTPGYHTEYSSSLLSQQAKEAPKNPLAQELVAVGTGLTKGYMNVLAEYIDDAARGPKNGYSARTTLWGLQRPPLGTMTELRAGKDTDPSDVALYLLPFHMTNARDQVTLSVHPDNKAVWDYVSSLEDGKYCKGKETDNDFATRVQVEEPWNVVNVTATTEYPLVGHFVSLLFPLGHIKSVKSDDKHFVEVFSKSDKWLRTV